MYAQSFVKGLGGEDSSDNYLLSMILIFLHHLNSINSLNLIMGVGEGVTVSLE